MDSIPLLYTELFSKLLKKGLIESIHLPSLKPPFPNGIKLSAIVTITPKTLGIHWSIVAPLSTKYKNWSKLGKLDSRN